MVGGIMATKQFILFYNAGTRAGATALIDSDAVLMEQHEMDAGSFGDWTHIVG
jgi:hypothetical protein